MYIINMEKTLKCVLCGHTTEKTLQPHINSYHNIKVKEYMDQFPGHPVFTEAIRESSRISNKNRDQSYRKKLSNNTKRLFQDPEWTKKHNEALKKAQNTPEAKERHKQGAVFYYSNRTSEQKANQKEACKKAWTNPLTRENRVKGIQKANNSEIVRQHRSEAIKKYLSVPDNQEKRNRALKEAWSKPENREKLEEIIKMGLKAAMSPEGRANLIKANLSPEVKENRQKAQALINLNPEVRKRKIMAANRPDVLEKKSKGGLKGRLMQRRISSLNIKFGKALHEAGLFPEEEYTINHYMVDFCFPEQRLIVEVDGNYWHGHPEIYTTFDTAQKKNMRRDKGEATYCKNHNWTLLRFWEKDINADINACIQQVILVLESNNLLINNQMAGNFETKVVSCL